MTQEEFYTEALAKLSRIESVFEVLAGSAELRAKETQQQEEFLELQKDELAFRREQLEEERRAFLEEKLRRYGQGS